MEEEKMNTRKMYIEIHQLLKQEFNLIICTILLDGYNWYGTCEHDFLKPNSIFYKSLLV